MVGGRGSALVTSVLVLAVVTLARGGDNGHFVKLEEESGTASVDLSKPWWNRTGITPSLGAHDPELPVDHGYYVSYRPKSGFNNQRECLTVALFLAFVLNRTLLVPPVTRSKHDVGHAASTRASSYFDLDSVREVVPVLERLPRYERIIQKLSHGDFTYHPQRDRNVSINDIKERYANSESKILYLSRRMPWVYVSYLLDPDACSLADRFISRSLHFTDDIFKDAMVLRDRIAAMVQATGNATHSDGVRNGSAGPPTTDYHGVHLRLGDRYPYPLVNCSRYPGFTEALDRTSHCQYGTGTRGVPNGRALRQSVGSATLLPGQRAARAKTKGKPPVLRPPRNREVLTMLRAILHSNSVAAGQIVYVATNEPKAKTLLNLREGLNASGIICLTMADVATEEEVSRMLAVGPSYVSAVEQVVVAYAGLDYFGTFPSSWDELVVDIRRWLGVPGSSQLADLFRNRVDTMLDYDHKGLLAARGS